MQKLSALTAIGDIHSCACPGRRHGRSKCKVIHEYAKERRIKQSGTSTNIQTEARVPLQPAENQTMQLASSLVGRIHLSSFDALASTPHLIFAISMAIQFPIEVLKRLLDYTRETYF